MSDDIKPLVFPSDGVPMCQDSCPSYDGKRCRVMGFRPDRICEPAVKQMAAELKVLKGARDDSVPE